MKGNQRHLKRIEKEIEDFQKYTDQFSLEIDKNNPTLWEISFKGAESTVYSGEKFTLQFKFTSEYVYFYLFSANR